MSDGILSRWFGRRVPAATFGQQNQSVEIQTNVGIINNYARGKLPPIIERFTYRLDRSPQCAALQRHFDAQAALDRPVCVIVAGTLDDVPDVVGDTLRDFLAREVLPARRWLEFHRPRSPLCRQWRDSFISSDHIWQEIGQKFLDLPALNKAEAVRAALATRPESVIFGFELDITGWVRHEETLKAWIDTLRGCRTPQGGIALALIVLSSHGTRASNLQGCRDALERRYQGDADVVVLPMLDVVALQDFRAWSEDLLDQHRDHLQSAKLATLAGELFQDEERRPMRLIWDALQQRIQDAYEPP